MPVLAVLSGYRIKTTGEDIGTSSGSGASDGARLGVRVSGELGSELVYPSAPSYIFFHIVCSDMCIHGNVSQFKWGKLSRRNRGYNRGILHNIIGRCSRWCSVSR